MQFDSTGKGSTGEVDNANCVISKADIGGGVGDPMEVDGEKKIISDKTLLISL
jgi:hypothetical protein